MIKRVREPKRHPADVTADRLVEDVIRWGEKMDVSLELAITWHMQSNHYPPHPRFMIPVAIRAIELANDGLWDEEVELPEIVQWAEGYRLPTAAEVVESFHLDSFITD